MKIGINLFCYAGLDVDIQIEYMKKYGFTNTFTDSEVKGLCEIMEKLSAAGIVCDTFHAPFNKINDMWSSGEEGEQMLKRLTDSVDRCEMYGVPVLIVHLSAGDNAPRINDIGYSRFERLVKYADSKGVKIAFENQRKLANLAFAMEQFDSAVFCFDTGHEECFAYGRRFMPLFGDRLAALHIHDNFKVHNGDKHMLPFDAAIDFERVARQIAESGFDGTVMLEVFKSGNPEFYGDISADGYYARAAAAVKRIAERIEFYKKVQ